MTMTIKLDPEMERALRQQSAALGVPASAVIREALSEWLESRGGTGRSAFELGEDLFGKHVGPEDLASDRKRHFADVVDERDTHRER